MAPPSAAWATRAKHPPGNSPAADWSHGEAGIDQLDRPGEASSGTSPKRWWIGGSGTARSMKGRICSCGGRPNSHGCSRYANRPRTGSSLITRSRIRGRAHHARGDGPGRSAHPGSADGVTPASSRGVRRPARCADDQSGGQRRVVERVGVDSKERDGSKQRTRVLVADDEAAVRAFLAGIVGTAEELELVAAAADAAEAVELTGVHRPDVAVIDVNMPGGGGPHATREIRLRSPNTRVLALSASQDHEAVMEMPRSGALGYVVKGAPVTEILDGIREAARGRAPLSSEVARDVVTELTGRLEREAGEARRRDELIGRIRAVMERDLLSVVFQPIFDVERGRMVGAEALSRFEPGRRPDEWFAEAASVGLGVELELWAARVALRHFGSLPAPAYVSVNLSPETVQ